MHRKDDHYFHGVIATIIAFAIFFYSMDTFYYNPIHVAVGLIIGLVMLGLALDKN